MVCLCAQGNQKKGFSSVCVCVCVCAPGGGRVRACVSAFVSAHYYPSQQNTPVLPDKRLRQQTGSWKGNNFL